MTNNNNNEREHFQVFILGSGPAGYTAAIYAARSDLSPVVYTGMEPGGQLMITNDVENYPGFPDGIKGPEMMELFKKQAQRFGTDVRMGTGTAVDLSVHPFRITIDDEKEVEADSLIISTGATAKWLGLESENRLNGHGVSACAVCDGFFYKGEDVAVVGGGDTAAEEALHLSKLCNKVTLLVRRDVLRASPIMQNRLFKQSNIEVLFNHETKEILGKDQVEGALIFNNETMEEKELKIGGFFVAIGHKPNTEIFKGQLDMDEMGYIMTEKDSTKTNIEGVFAAGDAQDSVYRQAVTAAGTGCMAALEAEKFLVGREIGAQ